MKSPVQIQNKSLQAVVVVVKYNRYKEKKPSALCVQFSQMHISIDPPPSVLLAETLFVTPHPLSSSISNQPN
jgi:hypothetical protein